MRSTSRLVHLLPFLTLVAPAVAPGATHPDTLRARAAAVNAHVERLGKLGFAGVFVLEAGGAVLVERGCGLADREAAKPWSTAIVSDVGSITKQFTAAAILRLQEQGRLQVQDPLGKHIEGVPPDKAGITLHHLLTHTSGILDVPDRDDWDPVNRDEIVRLTMSAALATPPGTHYAYSNAGYSLLGVVIERITGGSYEGALRDLLFAAAGMHATGYVKPEWDPHDIAAGYLDGKRWGTTLERPFAPDGPYWILRANGGLHSTAPDMLRWARALMDGTVLTAASRQALWSKHVDESNGRGESWYGYGWTIIDLPGRTAVKHNGGNGIHYADFMIEPSERIVAFFMTNVVSEFPTQQLLDHVGRFLFTGQPLPEVPDVQPLGDFSDYLGFYGLYKTENGYLKDPSASTTFMVRVEGNALAIDAPTWRDFSRLYGAAPGDLDRFEAQSRTVDACVVALLRGDYTPMHAAYDGRVPIETLRERGEARLRDDQQRYGPLRAHRTLGTLRTDEGSMTFVQFDHEHGTHWRRYVWSADGTLRGLSGGRRGAPPRFYRTPRGLLSFEIGVPPAGVSLGPDKGAPSALMEFGPDGMYVASGPELGVKHVIPDQK
jgi:CubicO group peptidase (beta-lactamase class C family)